MSDSVTVTVNGMPILTPTINLTANPASVDAGDITTLSWTSANVSSCTASGGWLGGRAVNGSEDQTITTNTTFTLTCTGPGGVMSDSVTVTLDMPPPPSIVITAEPSLVRKGQTAEINIEIASEEDLSCQIYGVADGVENFPHTGDSDSYSYEFTTKALSSAQIVKVKCVVDIAPSVSAEEEYRINVVSTGGEV